LVELPDVDFELIEDDDEEVKGVTGVEQVYDESSDDFDEETVQWMKTNQNQ
jgi:hypothetical protein